MDEATSPNDEITRLLRAGLAGEMTVEEVADRLHDLGVRSVGIRSVLPAGQSNN